jgi:hypothetical protein
MHPGKGLLRQFTGQTPVHGRRVIEVPASVV